jgi:AraC family transcriptional activator of pobA
MQVQVYDDINESHQATGYPGRTDLPDFHIFTLEDTYPHTRQVMPPYRFNFYQMVYFENAANARLNMNADALTALSDSLLFASPEHVLTWVRGEAQRGYILYFKAAFLTLHLRPVLETFPFFRVDALNYFSINADEQISLRDHFGRLHDLFHSYHPYRVPMLQTFLLGFLFDCKRLFDAQQHALQQLTPQQSLMYRFRALVNQHYASRKKVRDYAALLAVTPDYLGQVVRETTGMTSLSVINEQIMLEAQKLLLYSDLNISEIAIQLGYEEPTHFGRFFRKQTGMSPLTWRTKQQPRK